MKFITELGLEVRDLAFGAHRIPSRIARRVSRALQTARAPTVRADEGPVELETAEDRLWAIICPSLDEYRAYVSLNASLLERRDALERAIVPQAADYFAVDAYCSVCRRTRRLHVDILFGERGAPNWRERLVCGHCKLPNRIRAVYDFLDSTVQPGPNAAIYVMEQSTPFFRALSRRYAHVIGSEHLGNGVPLGARNRWGIRNEDLTRLTLDSGSVDVIVATDVLEHVPNYGAALAECFRSLKEGGSLIVTVPFVLESPTTLVRARVRDDASIEYCLPPEYHGDPLHSRGALCYYHFGWDFLDHLREAGFSGVCLRLYWSFRRGYLGGMQLMITAQKA